MSLLQEKKNIEKILSGNYDYILNLDVDILKKNIESGKMLGDSKTVDKFLIANEPDLAYYIFKLIMKSKEVLNYTSLLSSPDYENYKKTGNFPTLSTRREKEDIENVFLAEQISKNETIYKLLDFYMENEETLKELSKLEQVLYEDNINRYTFKNDAFNQEAHNLIKQNSADDLEVGIIEINDSKNGIIRVAGTRKDIALSNMLGCPFPKDVDDIEHRNVYIGEWEDVQQSVSKKFYSASDSSLTAEDIEKINNEIKRREATRNNRSNDEYGYISTSVLVNNTMVDSYLVVSKNELIDNGFVPEELEWKSLRMDNTKKVVNNKKKLVDFFKRYKGETLLSVESLVGAMSMGNKMDKLSKEEKEKIANYLNELNNTNEVEEHYGKAM